MTMVRAGIGALWFLFVSLVVPFSEAHAVNPNQDSKLLQFGGFDGYQGQSQHVPIAGLIGNQYTLSRRQEIRPLVGLGYLFTGHQTERVALQYGVNAMYLFNTMVKGHVIQENAFETLSYRYKVANLPVYAMGKMNYFPSEASRWWLTAEAGIGPNFMTISDYREASLNGISLPDNAFFGRARTVLSGMAGVGVRVNHALGRVPLELGYRFMYLGKSTLSRRTTQLGSDLRTGDVSAHAVVLTFIF